MVEFVAKLSAVDLGLYDLVRARDCGPDGLRECQERLGVEAMYCARVDTGRHQQRPGSRIGVICAHCTDNLREAVTLSGSWMQAVPNTSTDLHTVSA
ncbi:hypothetical protein GCM10010399_17770 [Dactylosporangium fulvum]|uniref:Uncharacterized protein n=1 Tax=Dactylosporangium fulvum TaxID=53359 RepID=A0ABY5VX80_9ACTN|nr:hypothetical protein [Dactylosporangium fulvum]UWP80396.1 hypothetical protein Dfulv_35275 [Dactylosporangium fulvum]